MSNHFHMITKSLSKRRSEAERKQAKPREEKYLPSIMQWIKSAFAKAWNKDHDIKGVLWQGVYFSWRIKTVQEFLEVFSCIDNNPVKAGMVERPEQYEYGRYWNLLEGLLTKVKTLH